MQSTDSRISGYNGTTWDRIRAGITAVTSTFTGFLNSLPWAVYHATPTTRTDGQGGPLESDSLGSLNTIMKNNMEVVDGGGLEGDSIGIAPKQRSDGFNATYNGTSSATPTAVKNATSSKKHYICDVIISTDTAQTVLLQDGAGSPVNLIPKLYLPANSVFSKTFSVPIATSATNLAINVVCGGGSGNVSVQIGGYTI